MALELNGIDIANESRKRSAAMACIRKIGTNLGDNYIKEVADEIVGRKDITLDDLLSGRANPKVKAVLKIKEIEVNSVGKGKDIPVQTIKRAKNPAFKRTAAAVLAACVVTASFAIAPAIKTQMGIGKFEKDASKEFTEPIISRYPVYERPNSDNGYQEGIHTAVDAAKTAARMTEIYNQNPRLRDALIYHVYMKLPGDRWANMKRIYNNLDIESLRGEDWEAYCRRVVEYYYGRYYGTSPEISNSKDLQSEYSKVGAYFGGLNDVKEIPPIEIVEVGLSEDFEPAITPVPEDPNMGGRK